MSSSALAQIRGMLAETRADADQVLAQAAREAREVESAASAEARRAAEQRLQRVEALRDEVLRHSEQIETAYVAMVESLAATAMRLAKISREADFSPPEWKGGIDRAIAIKLSETREMTLRLGRDADEDAEAPTGANEN